MATKHGEVPIAFRYRINLSKRVGEALCNFNSFHLFRMSDDATCCTREIHICVQTNEVPSLGNQIFQSDRSTYSLRYWTPHERCIKRRCSSIVVIVSKLHSQELIGQAGSRHVFNRIQYVITLIRVHQEIITWLDSNDDSLASFHIKLLVRSLAGQ